LTVLTPSIGCNSKCQRQCLTSITW
jgi:hypothetical protein